MTTIKLAQLSWKGEVDSVLAEAGATEADLARDLGVHRATVHRYFTHRPNPETVERVSEAVAELVLPTLRTDRMPGEPGDDKVRHARFDVAGYLQAVAKYEFGDTGEAADVGLELALRFVEAFIEHASVERVKAALSRRTRDEIAKGVPRSRRRATKFGLRMLLELRRIALDIARANYPTASRFDRIVAIFESVDKSLEGRLVPKVALAPILIYERFHARIAEAVARRVKGRDDRLSLRDDIEGATRELINELNLQILPTLISGEKES